MQKNARRWLRRSALLIALVLVAFEFGWVPFWLSGIAISRRYQFQDQENQGLDPAALGLAFQDVRFNAPDGVPLDGWWIPAARPRGTVILIHGLNRSRIEMVRKLPFVNREGWNALLFDLRHHGRSGGAISSFGYLERGDVRSAVAWSRGQARGPIVAWGVSLGGASAVLAAAEEPGIDGVICDSSFRSLRDTVRHHLGLFRRYRFWLRLVPIWPVADETVYWIGVRAGFDPDALDIVATAPRLAGRPCLFVCNAGDRRMPPEIAFELRAAVGDSARVLVVPGSSHGGAYRDGTAAYQAAVSRILRSVLNPTGQSQESAP